ncbi:XLF-domain-containing protein [Lophiostoma macrostomum CBS 122681]|uniref:Non-homologous end-joining factor 1 n=1 Tax=Lophiostoma macrostomum CBS 122681 TaxID=1314788 RepID=A0A6A6TED1_9PLEO|nr:XLF-domain-containing protein [Lophiostoma macrostomum CBS 122681]
MACWRVLALSDLSPSQHVPQLLVKPTFERSSYTVFLTDLSNIWSEELDLGGIVARAQEQESQIEISRQDTSQLGILLEHVHKSLTGGDDTLRRLARDDADDVSLYTSINLPAPLGSLKWRFHFRKRTPLVLKNELILPLLISSHIQHERINGLVANVHEKDRAINKMLDQFESSNLDLTSAFPSIGGSKPGRRIIKREQAARHVPALQPFEEDKWRHETGQLSDGHLSKFGLFQEALSECTSKVPSEMQSGDEEDVWWTSLKTKLDPLRSFPQSKQKIKAPVKAPSVHSDDETETEDEFESHENFKEENRPRVVAEDDVITEDEDEDLDAPPKSQSQSQRSHPQRSAATISTPEPTFSSPPRRKGFRIGGAKVISERNASLRERSVDDSRKDELNLDDSPPASAEAHETVKTHPVRRPFKIGGKKQMLAKDQHSKGDLSSLHERNLYSRGPLETSPEETKRRSPVPSAKVAASPPQEEEHEETAEEKAERKRRELKRKNEELAKKQALKKKKRF